MNFEFMTIDTPLPPCMPFPRALTGFPVSSTAKVMYCRMLDVYKINGTLIVKKNNQVIIRNIRRNYFNGYFMEEDITSENDSAWYVTVNLESDEEVTDLANVFEDKNQENKLELLKLIEQNKVFNVFIPTRILKHQPDADQAQRAEPHGLAAQLAVCTAL